MTRQFANGKRLAGTLLAGAAIATCLAIGAEQVGAFGFRGGGGFGGFHGGGGFGGSHGGGFQRGSFGGGGSRFGDSSFADRSRDSGFGQALWQCPQRQQLLRSRRHLPAEPPRIRTQYQPIPRIASGGAAKRVAVRAIAPRGKAKRLTVRSIPPTSAAKCVPVSAKPS